MVTLYFWSLITFCDSSRGNKISPVCLGLWDLRCALPQRYRTTLCTTDLRFAPACIIHHGRKTFGQMDCKVRHSRCANAEAFSFLCQKSYNRRGRVKDAGLDRLMGLWWEMRWFHFNSLFPIAGPCRFFKIRKKNPKLSIKIKNRQGPAIGIHGTVLYDPRWRYLIDESYQRATFFKNSSEYCHKTRIRNYP